MKLTYQFSLLGPSTCVVTLRFRGLGGIGERKAVRSWEFDRIKTQPSTTRRHSSPWWWNLENFFPKFKVIASIVHGN
jgi:hypothetical protein